MITKYIGSATDLKNCSKLAIIYAPTMLNENDIPNYVPTCPAFNLIAIVNKERIDDEEKFEYKVEQAIEFNAIIMYSEDATPLGFTILNTPINTEEYNIKTIGFLLNFTINNSNEGYIEISTDDVFYEQHIIDTSKVHKKLIPNYAVSKIDLKSHASGSAFGNTITEMHQDKLYRYSGNLFQGHSKLESTILTLPNNLVNRKVLNVEGVYYGVAWDDDQLYVDAGDSHKNYLLSTRGKVHKIGSNYLVLDPDEEGSEYHIYPTKSFINLENNPTRLISIKKDYKFVENMMNNELMEYKIQGEIITRSTFLSDLLDRYPIDHKDVPRLVSLDQVMEGLIVYTTKDSEGNLHHKYSTNVSIEGSNVFSYDLPHELATCLSSKAIIVKRTIEDEDPYWVLISIEPKTSIKYTDEYKVVFYNLGRKNNWRKLDLLSKHALNPHDLDILMTAIEGRLFRIIDEEDSSRLKLRAL